eukprot:scaffold8216_cov47-Phaeocystis_antarctica.AAC.1
MKADTHVRTAPSTPSHSPAPPDALSQAILAQAVLMPPDSSIAGRAARPSARRSPGARRPRASRRGARRSRGGRPP